MSFTRAKTVRMIVLLVMVIAFVLLIYMEYSGNFGSITDVFSSKETVLTDTDIRFASEVENKVSFVTISGGQRILKITKDGITAFTGEGRDLWNDTYTMNFPVAVVEGSACAVSEVKGHFLRVYNEMGQMYVIPTDDDYILHYAINKNGYSVIIIKRKNDYKTLAYNSKGALIFDRFEEAENIYPIAADISDDGRIIAVSYLDSSGLEIASQVCMFYSKESAEWADYPNSMFWASPAKQSEVTPILAFMDENHLLSLSDKALECVDEKGNPSWYKPLDNKVRKITFATKSNIAVAYGESITGVQNEKEDTIEYIALSGKLLFSVAAEKQVTYLNASDSNIIVGEARRYYSLDSVGRVTWSHDFTQDVDELLPMGTTKSLLFVGRDEARVMRTAKVVKQE